MQITPKSVVIDRDGGRMRFFWGPKCAQLAGLVKATRRKSKPPTPGRARAFAGQIEWIETTEEGIEA